jgi:hypothetical protein
VSGTLVSSWCSGTLVLWCSGALVLWCSWCPGAVLCGAVDARCPRCCAAGTELGRVLSSECCGCAGHWRCWSATVLGAGVLEYDCWVLGAGCWSASGQSASGLAC